MAPVSRSPIYLDHNATTPVFPEVVERMRACWSEPYLNPASQHEYGRQARRTLEEARDRVAELLGARISGVHPDRVVFTSGGTEANNLAIRGLLPLPLGEPAVSRVEPGRFARNSPRRGEGVLKPHIIISSIEHPSITTLADHLARRGCHVDRLGVDRNGLIRTDELPHLLRPNTRLVAGMLANNETGVLQPVADLAAICNDHGVPLHTDAAQAAGKLPLRFHDLGVATMSIAAHKFGGPLGIGALLIRNDVQLSPLLHGGVQQAGIRPGTESVALAVGMQCALEQWDANRHAWHAHLESLRNQFESALQQTGAIVIGQSTQRLPNTSNIAFPGLDRQQLFLALDQAGIACSTGSACASGSSEPSPVHVAMGCEPGIISSALRFSFGVQTTPPDVEESSRRIIQICNNLRR